MKRIDTPSARAALAAACLSGWDLSASALALLLTCQLMQVLLLHHCCAPLLLWLPLLLLPLLLLLLKARLL
jgi:hypothetical protein